MKNSKDIYTTAFNLVQRGQYNDAEKLLHTLLEKHPGHPDVLHLIGVLFLESGRLEESLKTLGDAVAQRPDQAQFQYHYGLALARTGDIADAEKAFSTSIELDGNSHDARYNLAKTLKDQGFLDRSAAVYQDLLDRVPTYTEALYNLANLRYEMDMLEEAEALFKALLARCPQHLNAQTNLALIKGRHGQSDEALRLLNKVVETDPTHNTAKQHLRQLYNNKIPSWHFDMLNDEQRNNAYDAAIGRAAKTANHVLEIGTGSGLLALMAARAGARKVTTCEMSKPLADVARKVIARNGYAEVIQVIAKKSTRLEMGSDLLEKADVLIAEVFDNGLLGEHFLPALLHAKRNLLQDRATIVPAAATIYAMLIECPQLRRVNPVADIAGFDLSDFDVFRRVGYRQINLDNMSYQALSEPMTVCRLDFQNESPAPQRKDVIIKIRQSGVCHAVAFWFDLHLDDKTTLSTLNSSHTNHWKQALQFFEADHRLSADDVVRLEVTHTTTGFAFSLKRHLDDPSFMDDSLPFKR